MKWAKKGRVYVPDGQMWWAQHYAFPPTPIQLDDELLRIYVGSCDANTVGRVGYVDVLLDQPSEVIRVSEKPVLDIGEPGCFDDNGVVPTSVVRVGDDLYLYYTGFQLGTKVKYFQFLGLAISRDGGESFERFSHVPVLDRTDQERHNRASGFVHRSGERFRIYYSGGAGWTQHRGKALPIYQLRSAESEDGKSWGESEVVLDFASEDEHVIGRPWLVGVIEGVHRMLYSVRTKSLDYRIGLAVSEDGVSWERRDGAAGIDVSATGWDSQMVGYGATVEHDGSVYLFYCGNERGKTGFGYAELEEW